MAVGWTWAFDTPFKWTKQVASDFGGTRNGMVIQYPEGVADPGTIRTQFTHVTDIAPTILELANLPEPKVVNGVPQIPMAGTSLVYSMHDKNAAEQHTVQYFEMFGNRALYKDGWMARTIHKAPWSLKPYNDLSEDVWELYNVKSDFSLSQDLAAEHPERLEQMISQFMAEAKKYHVLPIDDRAIERTNPQLAGRPDLLDGRTSLTLYEGMEGMLENTFINIKNKSFSIEADLNIVEDNTQGVILAQGGRFGGWSLHMKEGKPEFVYNFLGLESYAVSSNTPIANGSTKLKLNFAYDGDGLGKGGFAYLLVDGTEVAQGRIERTQPNVFSADETADVGLDNQTPVAQGIGYGPKETRFTGKINSVTVTILE